MAGRKRSGCSFAMDPDFLIQPCRSCGFLTWRCYEQRRRTGLCSAFATIRRRLFRRLREPATSATDGYIMRNLQRFALLRRRGCLPNCRSVCRLVAGRGVQYHFARGLLINRRNASSQTWSPGPRETEWIITQIMSLARPIASAASSSTTASTT